MKNCLHKIWMLYFRFTERCYHNALYFEFQVMGLPVGYNVPFSVKYKGKVVGEYFADLVIDNKVILELKSVKAPEMEFKRIVLTR